MAALIGSIDSKRNASDDLCKSYRDENKKKDELIQQLCKIHPHNVTDLSTIKLVAPSRNNEVPALLVRIETLEDKLRKKQYEIDSKNEQLAVLKKESELNRLEFEKVDKENQKILNSNKTYENTVQTYESLKHRSEYTIKLLQDQYRESQCKIADLEARIKNHLNDRERIDHMKSNVETKYQEFLISISRLINFDNIADREGIINKLGSITDQNAFLNGKMHALEEKLQISESNAKEARETIVKLMNDFGGAGHDREELREAKNRFQTEKNDLKAQIDLLNNRLGSLQKLYDEAKNELESKTNNLLSLEVKVKEQQFSAQASETVFQSLLESLAAIIGTPFAPCASTEAAVKDRVKQLVKTVKDQSAAAEILDQRVLMLQKQFESQYETGKQLLDRTKDSDNMKQDLVNKIKSLEDELSAQEIFRDNIRCEKDRIIRYVRKLADLLQMDYLPGDNDTVGLLDLLEGRCQELMIKLSGGSWKCPRCVSINNPNTDSQKQSKRIASLKEEIEAKDLQIQLLEKRMVEFGKSVHPSSCLMGDETNRDRVHRLQHQLEESQLEIEELRRALVRSQSSDFEIHKQIKYKQQEELEQLSETVEKLDKVRQRQAKKIAGLKSQIEEKSQVLMQHGKRDMDYKQARQLLEEVRRREIKLNDFRSAIAQMIGVDVRCSPDPENEIKARIQKLMAMARNAVNTPFTPYYLSQEMPSAFQQGYSNPSLGGYTNTNNSINQMVPFSKPPNTGNPNLTNDTNGQFFGRRTQVPKNKIVFQSTDDKIRPNRARSTSPSKVDERKY